MCKQAVQFMAYDFRIVFGQLIQTPYGIVGAQRTAVQNLEHGNLTHPQPSSIFALLMGTLCLFFALFLRRTLARNGHKVSSAIASDYRCNYDGMTD